MRENCTSGEVRGAPGNGRSYRGEHRKMNTLFRMLLVFVVLVPISVLADEEHKELIDEYLIVSGTIEAFGPDSPEEPCIKSKEQECEEVFDQVLGAFTSFEALESDIRRELRSRFTVDELKGLVAFYKTELGRKYARESIGMTRNIEKLMEERMIMSFEGAELLENGLNRKQEAPSE